VKDGIDLSALPKGSHVKAEPSADGLRLLLKGSRVFGWARWLAAGFLIFWLAGWYEGEKSALQGVVEQDAPTFVRVFLLVWLAGWTVGGLGAAVFTVVCVWRRREETLVLEDECLVWTPGSVWEGMSGCQPRHWLRTLRHLAKHRCLVLPLREISAINLRRPADEDSRLVLAVHCHGREHWLGTELSEDEAAWLLKVLEQWQGSAAGHERR
jgi:hypothetical protein